MKKPIIAIALIIALFITTGQAFAFNAEGQLKSNQYLNSIGNNYVASWKYAAYTNTASTASASLVFKYYVDNLLSYSSGYYASDTRTISVSIT